MFMDTPSGRTLLALAALTLTLLAACSGDPGKKDTTDALKQAARPQAPPMAVASTDASVLAYAIVPNLKATAADARAMMAQFDPSVPDFEPVLRQELAAAMEWNNADGLRTDAPVHFIAFKGATPQEVDLVVVASITDEDAFLGQLPSAQKDMDGNQFGYHSFSSPSGEVYINFMGKRAVLSTGAGAFGQHKARIEAISGVTSGGDLLIGVEAGHLMALYGQEVRAGIEGMKQMMAMFSQMGPMAQANTNNMEVVFDLVTRLTEDTDRMEMEFDVAAELVSMRTRLQFKDGTTTSTFIKEQPAGNLDILTTLPSQGAMFMAGNINFSAANNAFKGFSTAMMRGIFPENVITDPAFQASLDTMFAQLDHRMATIMGGGGGGNATGLGSLFGGYTQVFVVKDGAAYRDAFRTMASFYARPDVQEQIVQTSGMKISFQQDAYAIGEIPVDRTTIEYDFSAMGQGMNEMMAEMGMGGPILFDLACTADRCIQVQGADGRAALTNLLKSGAKGERALPATLQTASARALASPMLFIFFDYAGIGEMIGGMGGGMGMGMGNPMAIFAPGQGADLSVTAYDTGTMELLLNIPLKLQR